MSFFFISIVAVLLVAVLSRDHDLSASEDAVLTAELEFDEAAIGAFPERIHLSNCARSAFTHADRVRSAREALRAEGFEDAGAYAIDEFPGVLVRLGVNVPESMFAVVFDHARSGVWFEVVSRYADGSRWTHTTLSSRGMEPRPENTLVSLPGATVAEVLARARGDRPREGLRRVHKLDVAPNFEQGYADWIAWRRLQSVGLGSFATGGRPTSYGEERKAA